MRVSSLLAPLQAPDSEDHSSPRCKIVEQHGVLVTMRDGTRLSVDIYAPMSAMRQLPSILTVTPYDNTLPALQIEARWFANRGYVVVLADSRGRYDSGGSYDPFDASHKTDGYDLVEWMAAQPWCNGKVGMYGASYAGWVQWWTASLAPPHLAAIVPKSAPPDAFENVPYQNGVLTGGWWLDWCALMSGRTMQRVGDDEGYGGWLRRREHLEPFFHTPYIKINEFRGMYDADWFQEMYRQNCSSDPRWKRIAYQTEESYSKISVPCLAFTGWFDASYPGTPINYSGLKKFGATQAARRPSMIIGPWTHALNRTREVGGIDYGPHATIDADGCVARWLDFHLKGVDNGVDKDPPVHIFVMGENRWRAEQDWPLPQTQFTKYYFTSAGRANSFRGDGVLSAAPPRTNGSDSYTYDPHNPTRDPFDTYWNHQHLDGALDTRLPAIGDDVLVYQTSPLSAPLEVCGPIEVTLYAATSARDTDWFVRLVDVLPDGRSLLLAEGAMRARNRDPEQAGRFNAAALSAIEPGNVYRYAIRFWRDTANVFKSRHRIRVEISSSWYPYFLPNLNTGADNVALVFASDAVIARQTVYHGPQYASHLLLPVIPARPDRPE